MKRVWIAAALAGLAFAAPAYAGDDMWEAGTTPDGGARLAVHDRSPVAGSWSEETYTVQVFRCPDGGACEAEPLAFGGLDDYGARRVALGSAAPGDVFEARFTKDGSVVRTERTPPWLGDYVLTRPPAVIGQPAEGATVSGDAGAWSGGWGERWSGFAWYSLAACRRADGVDCVEFSPFSPSTKLDGRWAGWYVFARGMVGSGHQSAPVVTDYVYPVYPNPLARLSVTGNQALSAPFGPIEGAPRPQPTASIRAKALRAKGRLSLGRVTCPVRCTVDFTVSGGGKALRRTWSMSGLQALTIAPRRGRLKVTVVVDGTTLASGVSKAR